jgi:hypothetical protein
MGASGWSYFVPYEADISAALQRLRNDVFARGDYATAEGTIASIDWQAAAKQNVEWARNPDLPPQTRESYLAAASEYRKRHWAQMMEKKSPPRPKPCSIEELLNQEGAEGTHSILDIQCISPTNKFGAISPLPPDKLQQFFASGMPSHAEIQDVYEFGSLEKYVSRRCRGIYIIAYRDGKPDEIFFAGCSGD